MRLEQAKAITRTRGQISSTIARGGRGQVSGEACGHNDEERMQDVDRIRTLGETRGEGVCTIEPSSEKQQQFHADSYA